MANIYDGVFRTILNGYRKRVILVINEIPTVYHVTG